MSAGVARTEATIRRARVLVLDREVAAGIARCLNMRRVRLSGWITRLAAAVSSPGMAGCSIPHRNALWIQQRVRRSQAVARIGIVGCKLPPDGSSVTPNEKSDGSVLPKRTETAPLLSGRKTPTEVAPESSISHN